MRKRIIIFFISLFLSNYGIAQYKSSNWTLFKYSGPGLQQIGWLASRSSKQIVSSPWSVGCETLDRDYTEFKKYKDYIGELGVKSARLQGGWAKCEKVRGVYDFNWLDTCVYGLYEQGIKPWITLCYDNPIYNPEGYQGINIFESAETIDAWCNWVEVLATRYKDVVTEWEIWNEPNKWDGDPAVYAKLLMKTSETLKRVQPDAIIIGFALARIPLDFTKKVFDVLKANNKLGIIDYLSYHHYEFNPDKSYPDVEKLKSLVFSYNPDIKLFQGENAAPSDNHYIYHALCDYTWTEISQAKWYTRRMAGDRQRGLRSSIFTIIDIRYPDMLLSMGLLRSNLKQEVLYKKPAFYAVQHMANMLDGSITPIGEHEYLLGTKNIRELTVSGFKKNDTPMLLIWENDQIPGDDFKWNVIDIIIENINFKNPVYIEMVSGKVYKINDSDWNNKENNVEFRNLPVWDSVIMIAERSQIKLEPENNSIN